MPLISITINDPSCSGDTEATVKLFQLILQNEKTAPAKKSSIAIQGAGIATQCT